ncbi:MAG: hypothetical protein HC789_03465 [Microcoleus sp. CSU_2_2]|nr:hypothetical protein [Microcoleus sp. SU_5_3]NJS09492.1 hypothetical protein [Microcoleus sp. CSU_2_2]
MVETADILQPAEAGFVCVEAVSTAEYYIWYKVRRCKIVAIYLQIFGSDAPYKY